MFSGRKTIFFLERNLFFPKNKNIFPRKNNVFRRKANRKHLFSGMQCFPFFSLGTKLFSGGKNECFPEKHFFQRKSIFPVGKNMFSHRKTPPIFTRKLKKSRRHIDESQENEAIRGPTGLVPSNLHLHRRGRGGCWADMQVESRLHVGVGRGAKQACK